MTATTAPSTNLIATDIRIRIQDMEIGRRYVDAETDNIETPMYGIIPGKEEHFIVASVEARLSDVCELREDRTWGKFVIVEVTYRNGTTLSQRFDTEIYCPVHVEYIED